MAESYGASRSMSAWLQLDVEVVGREPPVAAEDLGVVVDLALQRGGDLDRLDGAAEGPGERTRDRPLQLLLELLQPTHGSTLLLPRSIH